MCSAVIQTSAVGYEALNFPNLNSKTNRKMKKIIENKNKGNKCVCEVANMKNQTFRESSDSHLVTARLALFSRVRLPKSHLGLGKEMVTTEAVEQ